MNSINLKFLCGVVYDGYIYASCSNFNGLYRISTEKKDIEFISFFPGEETIASNLHINAFRYKNLLYFIPGMSKSVHVYDLNSNKMKEIPFRREGDNGAFTGHLVDENLWLFPERFGGKMYKVNLLTEEVTNYEEEYLTGKIPEAMRTGLFSIRTALQDGYIFLPIYESNTVLVFNAFTEEFERVELSINNLLGCYPGENGLWILADSGNSIYLWDYQENLLKNIYKGASDTKGRTWNRITENSKGVYVIPAHGNDILMLQNDQLVSILDVRKEISTIKRNTLLFYSLIEEDDKVWLLPYNVNYLVIIENDNAVIYDGFKVTEEMRPYKDYLNRVWESHNELEKEGENLELGAFIKSVLQKNVQENVAEDNGSNIWKQLN